MLFPVLTAQPRHIIAQHSPPTVIVNSQQERAFSVSWNSTEYPIPSVLQDNDSIESDQISVYAEFPFDANDINSSVIETNVSLGFGIHHEETGELLICEPGYTPGGSLPCDCLLWRKVDGIIKGDNVSIWLNFTNTDVDLFAIWADSENATYVHELEHLLQNNQMATWNQPEVGSFIADRSGSILIGLFNYGLDEGEYHLIVDTRSWIDFTNLSNKIRIPIPDSDGSRPAWFKFRGVSMNGTLYNHTVSGVEIVNVFPPEILDLDVAGAGAVKTITWIVNDRNSLDDHTFEILVSDDDGKTFQLLRTNWKKLTYDWDTTGFHQYNYRIQIRVRDSFGLCTNRSSDPFAAGGGPAFWPWFSISGPSMISIAQGASGQVIEWFISANHLVEYVVTRDGIQIQNGTTTVGNVRVSIDSSSVGTFKYVLSAHLSGWGYYQYSTVYVHIEPPIEIMGFAGGVSIGLIVVILWAIVLRRRNGIVKNKSGDIIS